MPGPSHESSYIAGSFQEQCDLIQPVFLAIKLRQIRSKTALAKSLKNYQGHSSLL